MALLAAFQALLAGQTGQEDVALGSAIANRTRAELEPLIGFFVNTLALRTDLPSNPTISELLGRVREVCLSAYTHQGLPFEQLVEVPPPAPELEAPALFQVRFVLQNAPVPGLEPSGLSVLPPEVESGATKLDLTLTLRETARGLSGEVWSSTDRFDAATIGRLVA
jgi:non-ribosomal peptide synthetase component F